MPEQTIAPRRRDASRVTRLERDLHGKASPSRTTPVDAFRLARQKFLAGERIDMQQLAAELGLHRTTLYRWVGTRDQLIGEILWSLAEPTLREADAAARARGADRIVGGLERYMRATLDAPFIRRFLSEEPELALRVLTTKESIVQGRSVASMQAIIEEEIERGALEPPMEPDDLAYLIVRIAESFLFTDIIAGGEPAPDKAVQAVRALLR
jgi:AcrR family transcriptional regulator